MRPCNLKPIVLFNLRASALGGAAVVVVVNACRLSRLWCQRTASFQETVNNLSGETTKLRGMLEEAQSQVAGAVDPHMRGKEVAK